MRKALPGIILSIVFVCSCGYTPEFTDDTGNALPESIAEMRSVEINGTKNWLIIRGVDQSKPLLLFVHGGPGSPVTPLFRLQNSELEKHFVVVLWEQRGAGKSYRPGMDLDDFTTARFVADTLAVTEYLRERFAGRAIFLVGHSWGSSLGLLAAAQKPGYFAAYIGVGQFIHSARQETISYDFVLREAQRRKDTESIKALEEIKAPVNGQYAGGFDSIMIQREILDQYGAVTRSGDFRDQMTSAILWSQEYTIWDKVFFVQGVEASLQAYLKYRRDVDFFTEVPEVKLPVYFLTGVYDYNTPYELVEEYVAHLKAPKKELIWFQNSAHYIMFDEPAEFTRALVEISVQ